MESPPDISLVLPAYNEGPRLEPAVLRALEALESLGPHEVIIAEDASTDGTREKAGELQQKHPGRVRHLHREQRRGRGSAVAGAFREARGGLLLYMDVDLATELKHLPELVAALRGGADAATGSRRLPESRAERSAGRRLFSGGYNTLVRLILRSRLHDHQCGFKGFRREAALALLGETRAVHWFWDTEMLVRAQRRGMRVAEIPVTWREQGQTTVRLGRDIVGLARSVFRLWWQLRREGRRTRQRHVLYLNSNILARPFDDQTQARIARETQAVLEVSRKIKGGKTAALASELTITEIRFLPAEEKRMGAEALLRELAPRMMQMDDAILDEGARMCQASGLRDLADGAHIALALRGGATHLLTCDDELIARGPKAVAQQGKTLKIVNPLQYLWE